MKIYIKKSLSTDIIKQRSAEQVKKMIRMIAKILNNNSFKFAMKLDTFFYVLNFIYNTYNLKFFFDFPHFPFSRRFNITADGLINHNCKKEI